MERDKLFNKYKNLPQYKNLSEEELYKKVDEYLQKDEMLGSLTFAVNAEEKKFAQELLNRYLEESSLESAAEKDTLRQLIDLEILAERYKKILKTEYEKSNPAIPKDDVEQLRETEKQIQLLKKDLGLSSNRDDQVNNVAKIIEDYKIRLRKWINMPENRSNYTFQCHNCGETFLVRRRLDKEKDEIKTHPWFIEGGILFNKEIFKDLTDGKITQEQAARYLDCSIDYLAWILKEYPLEKDIEQEEDNV
jgi:hypothetical protein